jgi:hypothetical protein
METPSGATVDYKYRLDTNEPLGGIATEASDIPREAITKKTVTHDGVANICGPTTFGLRSALSPGQMGRLQRRLSIHTTRPLPLGWDPTRLALSIEPIDRQDTD